MHDDDVQAFPRPDRQPIHRKPDDRYRLSRDPSTALGSAQVVPEDALRQLDADIEAVGGPLAADPDSVGALGYTMFDSPASQDNSVTVLLADQHIASIPSQSLVRIKSKDGRCYLGVVTAGPFAEPDGLRADSTILVTTVTRGGIFVPPYHGRVQVEILGEEQGDPGPRVQAPRVQSPHAGESYVSQSNAGEPYASEPYASEPNGEAADSARAAPGTLVPPRYRPLPNSPVFVLDDDEAALVLRADGDIRLGQVVGCEGIAVAVPSDRKDVLPRHTAILGTTGGGKSTTVARLIQQAQEAGCAVVLLDVEGEYSFLHQPTDDRRMLAALERRGIAPAGLRQMWLCHLVGRETANPEHPARAEFSLRFERLSPHAVVELLDLTEPQRHRFLQAYDVATALLRELRVFPLPGDTEDERRALEWDELETGYPGMELRFLMDVIAGGRLLVEKGEKESFRPGHPALQSGDAKGRLFSRVAAVVKSDSSPASWRAMLGKLATLSRLKVFDRNDDDGGHPIRPLSFKKLLQPGAVSVFDLSDTGSPIVTNLVIADLLRGVQEAQDTAYADFEAARRQHEDVAAPTRVLIVIEEAHEFLSAERISSMPVLFGQVARIARRGRKRWLGLVFVTQLPQHLPRELFGLVNGYILHKIADPQVIDVLRRTVSGIDDSLWKRLPGLAPGQAIVAFTHLARPLLVAMDPAPPQLRLVD
ncbi:MAG: ATP-binding protein [Chloroflexi bacterium]|nr:ATP-binding protein [Chloroflexota bacterium]